VSQERIRSFIAVDLDSPEIRDRIAAAQRGLSETRAQLKLVDPKIMHLTLRFLGEIPMSAVELVKEAMQALQFASFEVDFSGLGVFPNPNRISVVWVGIRKGQEELSRIFNQLEPALRKQGLPADDKGFNPHLTIARVRSNVNRAALADYVASMREQDFGKMPARAVRLKKSTLTPRGPIYTTIHEVTAPN
jgi:RNA 2',3'-cyclic 3'-phosphodiesterase